MKSVGPLLAIRADASHSCGIGHVMRTLAIAQEWQRRAGSVVYLSTEMPDGLGERLTRSDIRLHWLADVGDAAEAAAAANAMKATVLLVDHYDLGPEWWSALPNSRRWRTAAINDFADPIHSQADVLISPRAIAFPLQAPHATFSGPQYLLIREEIKRELAPTPPTHVATKILLILGGSDPRNAGPRLAENLLAAAPEVELRILVGPAATNLEAFLELTRIHPKLKPIQAPPDMRPHLEWADTAVVSPSTTAFEALHHGLALGLVITAANQREVSESLVAAKVALQIADARDGDVRVDTSALDLLLTDADWRRQASRRGAELVDGGGTSRICDLLGLPEFSFREVNEDDARSIWLLANDPLTRASSFETKSIPWEHHRAWFHGRMGQPDPFWFAVSATGCLLAVVRFDLVDEDAATISINLAPAIRSSGLSPLIVSRACDRFWDDFPNAAVDAWIKKGNIASQRCFEKVGFVVAESQPDRQRYRLLP